MSRITVVQRTDSPFSQLTRQAIAEPCVITPEQLSGLPGFAGLVLWDQSGCNAAELREISGALMERDAPVVLLRPAEAGDLSGHAPGFDPLGEVVDPASPRSLADALNLAGEIHARMSALLEERNELEARLEEREVIERAKLLLVKNLGLSEPEAMRRMQRRARDTNRKLLQAARDVLEKNSEKGNGKNR